MAFGHKVSGTMYTHPQQGIEHDSVLKLRQEAGRWLRSRREAVGLSQRELAKAVGIEYYTFISQIESGRGRVPPAQTKAWAQALDIPTRQFAIELLRYYDPLSYELIFGEEEAAPAEQDMDIDGLAKRIARLERLLK